MWREYTTPDAKITKVIPSERAAGNFSIPSRFEIKIFEPMKIRTTDKAYLRYVNRAIIAAKAKNKARNPKIAKMFEV